MGILVIFFIVTGLICYGSYLHGRIDYLREQVAICETNRLNEKTFYDAERKKANDIIDSQNQKISQFVLDEKDYSETLDNRTRELLVTKIQDEQDIKDALKQDSSSDNQLKIVDKLLREFSNE